MRGVWFFSEFHPNKNNMLNAAFPSSASIGTEASFPSSSCNLSNSIWPSAASRHAFTIPQLLEEMKCQSRHYPSHQERKKKKEKKDSNIQKLQLIPEQTRRSGAERPRRAAGVCRPQPAAECVIVHSPLLFRPGGFFCFVFLTRWLEREPGMVPHWGTGLSSDRPRLSSLFLRRGDDQLGASLRRHNTVFTTNSGGLASPLLLR